MREEKVSIVTGAASGIGLEIAKLFAQEGQVVVMTDADEANLVAAAKRVNCDYFVADLSKSENCKKVIDYTMEQHGKAEILVNVAGIQKVAPIEDFPEEHWNLMIALMLTAPFLLMKYIWPVMKAQKWGRIINLNSIHGLVASEYKSAYVSAKHGLLGLTKTAALEGGKIGITVNSICPAYVKTPLVDNQIAEQAIHHGITKEEVVNKVLLQKAAIKTLIEPRDVAETVKFLCSEAANHITGVAITMDGGWTAS